MPWDAWTPCLPAPVIPSSLKRCGERGLATSFEGPPGWAVLQARGERSRRIPELLEGAEVAKVSLLRKL
jgi:hypothetical protein